MSVNLWVKSFFLPLHNCHIFFQALKSDQKSICVLMELKTALVQESVCVLKIHNLGCQVKDLWEEITSFDHSQWFKYFRPFSSNLNVERQPIYTWNLLFLSSHNSHIYFLSPNQIKNQFCVLMEPPQTSFVQESICMPILYTTWVNMEKGQWEENKSSKWIK